MWGIKESEKIDAVGEVHGGSHKLIGLLIILLVFGSYFLFFSDGSWKKIIPFTTEYKNLKTRGETAEAIKGGDAAVCSQIEDARYKNICMDNIYLAEAKSTNDLNACRKISGTALSVSDCLEQVLFAKSLSFQDIDVCRESGVPDVREKCESSFYLRLAEMNDDVKICDNYSSVKDREYCVSYISGDFK